MDKVKTVEEAIMLCMSEGLKAFRNGDYDMAVKCWLQPIKAMPNYSKLDPKKLVVITPIKDKKKRKDNV